MSHGQTSKYWIICTQPHQAVGLRETQTHNTHTQAIKITHLDTKETVLKGTINLRREVDVERERERERERTEYNKFMVW